MCGCSRSIPSPNRDNGYDVTDFYGVHEKHGSLGDFVAFMRHADALGIRVIVDLVVNHTSTESPRRRMPTPQSGDILVRRAVPGDEIGIGDNLRLPKRECARTPMQRTAGRHGGFSTARRVVRPGETPRGTHTERRSAHHHRQR